jgi:26S proteasome regulatory subunit N6
MSSTAKAKTAKLSERPHSVLDLLYLINVYLVVRTLLNYFNSIPNSRQTQIDVLTDNIEWSKREKRIFLKHSLEIRLVSL